jgi:hypothetical protein
MKMRTSTVLKFLGCGLLVFLTADLQAQLIKHIQFSAAEGYTNGPLLGQPAGSASVWTNVSGAGLNTMESWTNADGSPWIIATVTNGNMLIYPDQNFGTNTSVNYWAIPFPVQFTGPITVTWDWRFYPTNGSYPFGPGVIPPDYDPTNNNYNATCSQPNWAATSWAALSTGAASWSQVPWYPGIVTNSDGSISSTNLTLRGTDHGFTLADSANRAFSGNFNPDGSPAAVFGCLSTPNRISSQSDARYNGGGEYGDCGGSGSWNNCSNDFGPPGPEFKDGKLLHHKLVAYVGDPSSPTNNSFDVWAQRDGEGIWQETVNDYYPNGAYPMRRCPNEYNSQNALPTSGIDCITLWLNTGVLSTHIAISNIVVLGPIPVLSAQLSGTNVNVTYSGTLQSADSVRGPYTDVVGQSTNFMVALKTLPVPHTAAKQFYRARQ